MNLLKRKNNRKNNFVKGIVLLLNPFVWFIVLILILLLLVSYIADIFYIGLSNEEKSNMKEEVKYYTTAEYTDEESNGFLDGIKSFINNIFDKEIIKDAEWPVVGHDTITSYYGKRVAPTTGASSFHGRN